MVNMVPHEAFACSCAEGDVVLRQSYKPESCEKPIPPAPVALTDQQVAPEILAAHNAWIKRSKEIAGLMQAEQELLQTMRDFHSCRQNEGQLVSSYVLKMKGYIDNLECLGHPVTLGLGVSLILIGLRKEYDGFVQNYNMHSMGKTVNELHAMLNLHEQTLPKNNAPVLNAIRAGKFQKGNKHKKSQSQMAARGHNPGKEKNKQAYAPKPKISPPPKREDLIKDSNCHECDGFVNRFMNNSIQVSRNNMVYFRAIPRVGIFEIDLFNYNTNESSIYAVSNKRVKLDLDSALLWHCRLGHISKKRIEKLQHDRLLDSSDLRAFEKCVSCMSGKMARKPYTHQVERAKDLLGLIHTDVCGPFKIMSRQGASYFITFTEDFNLMVMGEYMSQEFLDHLKDHGIIAHRTPPYTPQHNGVSERRNRTLLDMVRSMMSQITLPKSFWDYALETAARILNMVPTKKIEKTPYECIFIGYPNETMGYSFYYPPENKVLVARNTEFLENSLINQEASGSLKDLEIIQEEDTHPSIYTSLNHKENDLEIDEPQSDIIPIRRSSRTRHAPDRMCLYIDAEEHELGDLGEPTNYKVALLDSDKWCFKKKTDIDGVVHTYKARLVAKGYTQTPRIDYEETFSPVAHIRAFRILIAIAAYYDYKIWQMDVITAFLNGYLNEEKKLKLIKSQGASTPAELKRMQNVPYASAVGYIMYAVRCTCPDVAFAQNVTSRFQQNPSDLKREFRVSCYTDAGYLTDADDLKSQTGYVFVLNSGAIDWKSAKQSIFATSSAEAEYIAVFDASKEAVWVRKFISGLGMVPTIEEPISMYCDNTGAIAIANESEITKGARYFRAKVHYLQEVIEYGDIK
nr:hypothetical protein [Tanacetum cinerariifolium]